MMFKDALSGTENLKSFIKLAKNKDAKISWLANIKYCLFSSVDIFAAMSFNPVKFGY